MEMVSKSTAITSKRFNNGDIVYWCNNSGGKYSVKWGIVDEQYSDAVRIDFLELKEDRFINGIPIDEFIERSLNKKSKKLPKGWSYNTQLYTLTHERSEEEKEKIRGIKIDNPEALKVAYKEGLLVKSCTKFNGKIDTDITKEGYKIIAKWEPHMTNATIAPHRLYLRYIDAQNEVDANIVELKRQSELSDYEWSVEQIENTLQRWGYIYGSPEEVDNYRTWILDRDNVEDIETRIYEGNIQWKYYKNKKWNNIIIID